MARHHVAQLNVGRLLAPLDDPDTEGFVSALDPINALADRSPGFVWRLQTAEGNATTVRAFEDELTIVNYSIWESVESLKTFVFDTEHRTVLRQRREWFEVLDETSVVLWWVRAGEIPPVEEGIARLAHLVEHGPTPHAFTFREVHDPPDASPVPDAFDVRAQGYTPERIEGYNRANREHPSGRETERQLLISRLGVEPGMTVCDAVAGGGYVAEGIDEALDGDVHVICVENSKHFLDSIDNRFGKVLSSLGDIDLASGSVDRICCLAGLHHQERKADFFAEASRIVRPGGRVAVADVLDGSGPASFLNVSVDRFTSLGHDGMFLTHGELADLLAGSGFVDVDESYEQYTWDFDSREQLVSFCRTLFRMFDATLDQVSDEIDRFLEVTESPEGMHLHWSLVYASGCRPA